MGVFHFGDNLRALRKSRKLSQTEVAFHLNISQATYSRLENQKELPDSEMLDQLATYFKVDPLQLQDPYDAPQLFSLKWFGGRTLVRKVKKFSYTVGGFLILIAGMAMLADYIYMVVAGFCASIDAPEIVGEVAGTLAGILALIFLIFWLRSVRKTK